MAITHTKVSAITDGSDTDLVRPSDWNADHTIADKSISYTKLADGTDGNLITWDASGVAAVVATGLATQVLTSNGAGTAPTFQNAAAGSGDVTADDTSTTAQNVVAYSGTGGKNITELTGTQGDVLYHNGTLWSKLGAGTSGHFLKTQGAAANPAWASAGTNSGPTFPGGIAMT